FVRLLIRSFADRERVLTMQGVTIDELEEFYNTVKPLGVDLRYMDPGKTGVGARTFNEANLFTFNGDGVPAADANPLVVDRQEIMTYTETIELLALLWSAGQVRDRMYYRLVEECTRRHGPGQVDRLGDPKIPRECFYYEFARNQLVDMQNLPLMQNYL